MVCLSDVTEKSRKYEIVLLQLKDLAQIMWNKTMYGAQKIGRESKIISFLNLDKTDRWN